MSRNYPQSFRAGCGSLVVFYADFFAGTAALTGVFGVGFADTDSFLSSGFFYFFLYEPLFPFAVWDAGFLQLYRMSSPRSRDALPQAKNDVELAKLWKKFEKAIKKLGDKIADKYQEDTGF